MRFPAFLNGGSPAVSSTPRRSGKGFTLIEIVISSALMSLIIVSAYLCFSAAIASRKTMEPRLEVIQNARVALALISADLRSACPLDKESAFLGMHRTVGTTVADNLDFATHNYSPQRAGEGDFCQLSYYLDEDPETGEFSLWRRRNPTIAPDSLSGGYKDEIATGVLGLQFEYFDGLEWYESWGDTSGRGKQQTSVEEQPNLTGMPEAVRITIWFASEPGSKPKGEAVDEETTAAAPMMFQTVACLNLAKVSSSSGASSGDASGTPSSSTEQSGSPNPAGGLQQ